MRINRGSKGFVIAGTNSGCGKTSVSLGLMALLRRKGFTVAPFKVGPDYIDPGHHYRVAGRYSRNLDGWMLDKAYNRISFEKGLVGCDLAVVEGVMGLFDGYDGKSESGSTAQMAKWLDLPVVLVVNAQSMARSVAALVRGFEQFDPELRFAGVIFNKVGSPRHLEYLKEAIEDHVTMPCLGAVFRNPDIAMPERHLGLVTDDENGLSDTHVQALADMMEQGIDLGMLLDGIDSGKCGPGSVDVDDKSVHDHRVRIGIARDQAFCFYYPDNLDVLEQNGAELVFFSPMRDSRLPENLDGLYFGGGYPELFARELSENVSLRSEIHTASINGMPIYGECGGFMYLCRDIEDFNANRFEMAGCFPFSAVMFNKLKSLGYREVSLEKDTVIGKKGDVIRGHEFHYSELSENKSEQVDTVYRVSARKGGSITGEGYEFNRTLGSYIHLHFGSNTDVGRNFVSACEHYKDELINSSPMAMEKGPYATPSKLKGQRHETRGY